MITSMRRLTAGLAATVLVFGGGALAATSAAAADPVAAPAVYQPGSATLYQAYSHRLTDLGLPKATPAQITVYRDAGSGPVALPTANTYLLNNNLVFDTATGVIARKLRPTDTTNPAPDRYTVVINNGVGGAAAAAPATPSTPALVAHDVMVQFRIPVLFSDVPMGSQFAAEIYRMAAARITDGGPSGALFPGTDVRRQEFAHFVIEYLNQARADLGISFAPFGLPNPLKTGSCLANGVDSTFPDVADTNPFCTEIQELTAMGVTNGYETGMFLPTARIQRQEMAAMMYRTHLIAAGFTNPAVIGGVPTCDPPIPFSDVKASSVFCGHIEWMDKAGVTHGYPNGTFKPNAPSTRDITLVFLDRMGAADGLTGFGP